MVQKTGWKFSYRHGVKTQSRSRVSGLAGSGDVIIRTLLRGPDLRDFSVLALCRLFASDRPSLQRVTVQGDLLLVPETKDGKH